MNYLPTRHLFAASVTLALLTLVLLAACATDAPPEPTPTPPPPPTATPLPRGGNLTVRIAEDIPDLRPWQPRSRGEEQAIALLYNGLTRLDAELRPQPDLAQGWDSSPDGRLITFTLRTNIRWHDGEPFSANDVVFTLNALRAISPTTALLADFQRITEVNAPTDETVVLTLAERYAPLFSLLTVPILPQHLLAEQNLPELNFWDVAVGTGPFRLDTRTPDEVIELVANATYHRGQPLLDRVALVVAPDESVAADALADGVLLLAELPWEAAQDLTAQQAGLQRGNYPENGYYFLAFNTRDGRIFSDVRVRQALSAAVNVPELVREVTDGQGIAISSSAAPGSWADLVPPPTNTLNLELANSLLDEAGWTLTEAGGGVRQREGVPLAAEIFVRADDERRIQAAERIAEAGGTVGISLTVQPADFETVIRSKYVPPYDFDLLLGSWLRGAGDLDFGDYAYYDPDDFALFHSSQINQGVADTRPVLNLPGFSDTAYDNQIVAAQQLYDLEQRSQSLRLAQQRLIDTRPYLFLWADQIPILLNQRVTTLDGPVNLNTPMYLGTIERWYIEP